jgi:hypothetical protein
MKKYLKFNKYKVCNYSKKDFNFEEFVKEKYKRNDTKTNESINIEERVNSSKRTSKRSHMYFESKRISLIDTVKNELSFFKLDSDFEINDLRHKYLTLGIYYLKVAKLYHPDVRKNDMFSNMQFTKIQETYEKLKVYCEIRDDLLEKEDNVDDKGNIFVSEIAVDFNQYYAEDKKDVIKQLCNFFIIKCLRKNSVI